jgi:hypothetical protein
MKYDYTQIIEQNTATPFLVGQKVGILRNPNNKAEYGFTVTKISGVSGFIEVTKLDAPTNDNTYGFTSRGILNRWGFGSGMVNYPNPTLVKAVLVADV